MKYFTTECCFSKLEDQEIEERLKSYREYINKIYEKIPFVLKLLVKHINLHDGIIKNVSFFQDKTTLFLDGVFGSLQTGYFFLKIKYLNIHKLDPETLILLFKNQKIEILSDEIEIVSKNLFSHKMLFTTKKEIEITFEDIEIEMKNVTSQEYTKSPCKLEIH